MRRQLVCGIVLSLPCLFLSACGDGTPAYVNTLRPQIQTLMADTLTTGAVVMVRSPKGDWSEAFGYRDRSRTSALQINDQFRVGSVTKTWTGTVILQLIQEGQLALSDPVSRYVNGVPNGSNITIEQLLSMRSGLFNYSTDTAFNQSLDDNPTQTFDIDALLQIAYSHDVYFLPGAGYKYSNTNTLLLGKVIENLTHLTAAEAFRQRLFANKGLAHTFLPPLNNTALPAPFAHGYQYGTNVETIDTEVLSLDKQAAAKNGSLQPFDTTDWSTSWGWTAGMGISTADELTSFAINLAEGHYLRPSLHQQRLTSCLPTSAEPDAASYCWGLAKFGSYYGHTGEVPGYNTFMGHDPVSNNTVVVWTSQSAAVDGRAPAIEIARLVIAELAK